MIKLSELQKYHVICILKYLASEDRNFDLLEAIRIRLIGLKMDLHADKIEEAIAEDYEPFDILKKRFQDFEDEAQKRFLYQQCILLLLADGSISDIEQNAIDAIHNELGLGGDFHSRVLEWAKEGLEWEKRGEELVGGPLTD